VDAIVTEDEEVASGTAVLFIFVVILRKRQRCGEDRTHNKMGREERKGCVIDQAGKSVALTPLITTTYPPSPPRRLVPPTIEVCPIHE
jgi:hypothetical protein